jgi:RNA polymerase sigma factor (sigma-70 family)
VVIVGAPPELDVSADERTVSNRPWHATSPTRQTKTLQQPTEAQPMRDRFATNYLPGSASDFDRLYRNTYPNLKRTLTAVLGDSTAAEDCLQDAFVRAFRAWPRWRPEAPAEMWVQRIALNRAFTHRRKMALLEIGQVLVHLGKPEPTADPADTAEWSELKRALRRLPAKMAAVVVLRHYHGYTNRDIARLAGVSERTIGIRMSEGLRRLRIDLDGSPEARLPTIAAPGVLFSDGNEVKA